MGERELREEIKGHVIKSAGNDCIVPVSGGRDSAYALYYSKEVLGLSPIAVHSDNDFETEIARKNLKAITESLSVPLIQVASPSQLSKKIVAEKFKMNAPFGPGLVVYQTCEACKYGFESAAYNTARKKGIKLVIWGDSQNESTTSYHALVKQKPPTRRQRLLSAGILSVFKYKYYFNKMKKEYGPDSPDGLKEIHLYDYLEWDRETIVSTIENEMSWSKPAGSATSWRIDCSLVPLVDYLTKKAYGVSKIELGFSSMIRSNKMDRDDALRQLEQIEHDINIDQLQGLLREMNISASCINSVL